MAFNTQQAVIWKRMEQVYTQWNPERSGLMPVRELAERLPEVAPDMIGDTLAQAATDRVAEVGHVGEDPSFKPLLQ